MPFNEVFGITEHVRKLEGTLSQNHRWYKVGEKIFENHNNKNGIEGLIQIKHKGGMVQTLKFFDFFGTRFLDVKWSEFKRIGIDYKIMSFKKLSFDDGAVIAGMRLSEKEDIARAMVPLDGWEHLFDYYMKDEDDKDLQKKSISNSWTSNKTPTQDLVSYIFSIIPDYTMQYFFNACQTYGYNDTLKDLIEICSSPQFC